MPTQGMALLSIKWTSEQVNPLFANAKTKEGD